MKNVKSFLKSKTIWGAIIAVAPSVTGLFGYTITGADITTATGHMNDLVTAAGGLLAVFGRVMASKKIGI